MTRPAPSADPRLALLDATVHYLPGPCEPLTELAPDTLAAHRGRYGPRPEAGPDLLRRLRAAELTGRGGGHFPVADKWRRVLAAARDGRAPVVIANGAEGEPLSRKDAALLELRPHLVLDGLVSAAEALGAAEAVLWLHENAHAVRAAITRALTERAALDEPPIRVAFGPAHYLTGESSAVVNGVSGRSALPGLARVPAAQSGVAGRPTLVQNVETLARVALLSRGLPADSALVTVATGRHLVVAEVPSDASVAGVVVRTSGGPPPQAVLVGGYGGRWLTWQHSRETAVARAGAGVLVPLAADACGLRRTAGILDFLAESSARQCGPCRFGLPAIAELVRELAETSARRRDSRRLERYLTEVAGRGACHHPDGVVSIARTALSTFADDVAAHLRGRCRVERGAGG